KGEIALRGGIVDVFPLTQPWPVRLEFFGDELESLRFFDPLTQLSRESISSVTIPPGGELGILKRALGHAGTPGTEANAGSERASLASFLAYVPKETLILFCEPDTLDEYAAAYAELVPGADPFFIPWDHFRAQLEKAGLQVLSITDTGREPTA